MRRLDVENDSRLAMKPRRTAPSRQPVHHARSTSGRGDERAISRALAVIHANPFDSISLSGLAQAACLSRFHFARLFRSRIGRSPMQYVRVLRIERAKERLRDGSAVSAIAADLGYFDQSHFSRAFRKATGSTPANYARRNIRTRSTREQCQ